MKSTLSSSLSIHCAPFCLSIGLCSVRQDRCETGLMRRWVREWVHARCLPLLSLYHPHHLFRSFYTAGQTLMTCVWRTCTFFFRIISSHELMDWSCFMGLSEWTHKCASWLDSAVPVQTKITGKRWRGILYMTGDRIVMGVQLSKRFVLLSQNSQLLLHECPPSWYTVTCIIITTNTFYSFHNWIGCTQTNNNENLMTIYACVSLLVITFKNIRWRFFVNSGPGKCVIFYGLWKVKCASFIIYAIWSEWFRICCMILNVASLNIFHCIWTLSVRFLKLLCICPCA